MWNRLAVNSSATADAWIAVCRQVHDQLADLVRGLDANDLARSSACSEWDVAQVLGHLGSAAEISAAKLEATLAGSDEDLGIEFNKPIWARWNALDNDAKAAGFLEHSEDLVARMEALDADTRANLPIKLFFFPEPVDVAMWVRLRVSELAFHGWDVRVAFDPSATLFAPAVDLMLDHAGDFIGFLGHQEVLDGRSVVLAVETTDPSRTFGLVIADKVSLAETPSAPDATLRLPSEAWLRLTYGRLAPQHTPAAVTLTGDVVTLDDLRRVFPGI